jgi:hypothetical protein
VALVQLGACGGSDVSRELGARCDVVEECDERCLRPSDDYPGGFCTVSCDDSADCPGGGVCVDEQGGVCLFSCVTDLGCEFLGAGWRCQERDALPDGEVMACRGD